MQHIGAAAQLGKDQSIRLQFSIRILNGNAVHTQFPGKLAAGGQTRARGQAARENPLLYIRFDLFIKRECTLTVKGDAHFDLRRQWYGKYIHLYRYCIEPTFGIFSYSTKLAWLLLVVIGS